MAGISRRDFLKGAGSITGALFLSSCGLGSGQKKAIPAYRTWEDLYRSQYSWDAVRRSTHSANCTGSCSWMVYVKDNVIVREEQAADYPPINAELPDYNPRGCQKGACYVEYVYGAQRLKTPLRRVGERGEGKWKKITWDEAYDEIAAKVLDTIYREGPDKLAFFTVIPAMSPVSFAGGARFAHLVGGPVLSFYDWYCDLPPGEPMTWGVQTEACECADWFNSKYIVLWGSNISATRIPDAHFAWEARYKGAKIACISPDYNASSIHTDLYLPIRPGTDGFLALGMAKIFVDEKLYDAPYVKEQTDLPFLVAEETGRFLRASDLAEGGKEDVFYVWDQKGNRVAPAPGSMGAAEKTLALGNVDPALEGRFRVKTKAGEVTVTPVFERLKAKLKHYPLDEVATRTGVPASEILDFARDFANAKPAMIIHGAGLNHWYHNDLINRSLILLVTLTGNVGKNGGGFNHYVGQERLWPEEGFKKLAFPQGGKKQRFQNTTLWVWKHTEPKAKLRYEGRDVAEYVAESVSKGWMPLYPQDGGKPKVMFIWRANFLNQAKGMESILHSLWKDLDLIVNMNYRMDTTALHADIVLPASSYYEKTDINTTDCHSFIHPFSKVLDPLFDSKTDWDIWVGLSKALEKKAREKALAPYRDEKFNWTRDFKRFTADYTDGGRLKTDEDAVREILENAPETKGIDYKGISSAPQRFVATGEHWTSDLEPGVAYTPFKRQVQKKQPWPTLTGRQQFYLDHPWFLQFGEELPVYKPPLDHERLPLIWNTPHGRWSIHSTWRDNRYLLRLQRGMPVLYMNPADAQPRGIIDNDWVEVTNENGKMVCKVKLLPGERPGRITMYHGWEKYLGFKEGGWQSLTHVAIKPTQLVGGYGHVKFALNYWGPTGNNRDFRVEVKKYKGNPS